MLLSHQQPPNTARTERWDSAQAESTPVPAPVRANRWALRVINFRLREFIRR